MKSMPVKQAQARLYAIAQGKKDAAMTLLTWKQDRSLEVEKTAGTIFLREHGFQDQELTFSDARDCKHALKAAFSREFPRSNRVYVQERNL